MQKIRSFKKLITKNLLMSLVFTIVAMILVALTVHLVTLYKTIQNYNTTSSELVVSFIDDQIMEATRDLSFLSEMILKNEHKSDVYIKNFIEQYNPYSCVWVTDSSGIIENIIPGNEFLQGTDKSGSDVYQEIQIRKKRMALSTIFLASETNLPSFDVAIPFKNGILATTVTSTVFTNHLMRLKEDEDHFVTLTDHHASWLSHVDTLKVKLREIDPDFPRFSSLKPNNSLNIISKQNGKYYYRYIRSLHESGWYLSIFHPISEIYNPILTLLIIIVLISIPIVMISFSTSFSLIKKIFIPMDDFVKATEQIGQGDYHYTLPSTGYSEFDHVKTSLTKMVENIDQREKEQKELWLQLLQSQKMEAIGNLASGVAHDFNNLLTAIGGYSDMISYKFEDGSKEMTYIDEVNKAIERATALTRQLLAFSRQEVFKTESICVNSLIEGIIKMLNRIVGEDIIMEVSLDSDLPVIQADPHQFEQILLNLAVNSRDALIENNIKDPKIFIRTDGIVEKEFENKRYIKLIVSDNGPGIPEGIRNHIFESFFTTKEKGKGTGLGLSTIMGIITQNEAEIEVGDRDEGGACFTILWPIDEAKNEIEVNEISIASNDVSKKRVLYVDDESILCEIASEVLAKMNHSVEVAYNGEDAFDLIKRNNGNFDLLITDVIMPKLGGPELVKKVHEIWPDIKVLYVTGYVDERIEKRGIDIDGNNFLRKPFNMAELKNAIHKIYNS